MNLLAKWEAAYAALARELPAMSRLAIPVVIAELGWITMGVVDTIMVGRISPEAIGAVSIGSVLFYTIGVFGTGMLLGLDTLVPQAFGAGDLEDCHHSLIHAIYGVLECLHLEEHRAKCNQEALTGMFDQYRAQTLEYLTSDACANFEAARYTVQAAFYSVFSRLRVEQLVENGLSPV